MAEESAPERAGRVLVVDDDESMRTVLQRVLAGAGYEVVTAHDGVEALRLLDLPDRFDAVVSDIRMPHMSGVQLLRGVRERDLDLPVLLMTGQPDVTTAIESIEWGAYKYLLKPIDNALLTAQVRRGVTLCRMARAKREGLALLGHSDDIAADRAGMEVIFNRAISSLWIAYQPVVRAEDRSVFGYEGLLRSNEAALPHPGAFLQVAARLDKMHELGRCVRDSAAKAVAPMGGGTLFVNLHPDDLLDESLYDPEAPLSLVAGSVVLELTERTSLDEVKGVRERVDRLRKLGFRLALDDLGAGYSGLTSFALIEPDIVKIDMTLVRGINESAVKRKVVEKMTSLAHELDVLVVAEGVETAAERVVVTSIGCDLLQGYLFARPGRAFPQVT